MTTATTFNPFLRESLDRAIDLLRRRVDELTVEANNERPVNEMDERRCEQRVRIIRADAESLKFAISELEKHR